MPSVYIETTINTDDPQPKPKFSSEKVEIHVEAIEQQCFDLLTEASLAFEHGELKNMTVEVNKETVGLPEPRAVDIRVAGGWVRDKILGKETHDIDIAVGGDLTGVQYASIVQAYSRSKHNEEVVGKMGVIGANPAQSKHLETATMKVLGLELDFANLRSQEIYEAHSRIPVTKFGTPQEDAERRDFTVNALFFNIKTRQVEDWTKRGLEDLIVQQIVTPLEPVRTFRDDPLRVLRAIRFAVRYRFALEPALEQACQMEEIHHALHIKVSRERVGKELEGMLSGKGANPIEALKTMARLKLAGSVFCIPKVGHDQVSFLRGHVLGEDYCTMVEDTVGHRHARQHGWEEAADLLRRLPAVQQALTVRSPTQIHHRLLSIAVFLLPFRTLSYEVSTKPGKTFMACSYVMREGIKFKNADSTAMDTLQSNVDEMSAVLRHNGSLDRLRVGLLLRKCRDMWVTTLLLATVLVISEENNARGTKWLVACSRLYDAIIDANLDECWKTRPLLDGKSLIGALDVPRGPIVGNYMEAQVRWMLQHPLGTREECIAYLLSLKHGLKEQEIEQTTAHVGFSDGRHKPAHPNTDNGSKHFTKKVHVENMDTT